MAKIVILKKEGMNKKISHERRVYEPVDDNSQSYALSQKPTKKRTRATKSLKNNNKWYLQKIEAKKKPTDLVNEGKFHWIGLLWKYCSEYEKWILILKHNISTMNRN